MTGRSGSPCESCPAGGREHLRKLGVQMEGWDHVVALAGNPNTGKSTVFNALTGRRQHTGNWPGKTVRRAEGGLVYGEKRFKIVDLPGTYSLLATSPDEEVARDFLLFGRPDVTVCVLDATRLEFEESAPEATRLVEVHGRLFREMLEAELAAPAGEKRQRTHTPLYRAQLECEARGIVEALRSPLCTIRPPSRAPCPSRTTPRPPPPHP